MLNEKNLAALQGAFPGMGMKIEIITSINGVNNTLAGEYAGMVTTDTTGVSGLFITSYSVERDGRGRSAGDICIRTYVNMEHIVSISWVIDPDAYIPAVQLWNEKLASEQDVVEESSVEEADVEDALPAEYKIPQYGTLTPEQRRRLIAEMKSLRSQISEAMFGNLRHTLRSHMQLAR